ncbi:MAG: hypothetical protein GY867_10350 [bacterium]|nr:hypothetical protein [bacterium]
MIGALGKIKHSNGIRWIVPIALLVAAALICAPIHAAEPKYGGTLRYAGELDARGFDAIKTPVLLGNGALTALAVMEKLFETDGDGGLIPVLGLSATPSPDGKTWTVKLRRGVKFHDGTPFNADAVVKHWGRLLDPENRYRGRSLMKPILSVEKTGDYEVRFLLKHVWLPFIDTLSNSRGLTTLIPSPKAVEDGVHHRAPVGTGPFVFKEWKTADRIVVVKNPDYWQKGKPYLDKIVLKPISDHETRYATLASGQVDMMLTERPGHVKKLSGDPKYTTTILDIGGVVYLALNNSKPPLDDPRVRRALAHAWDQKKYIKACTGDVMPYAEHWLGDERSCGDVGYRRPDLEKARALIAEYGKPVELEYIHSATNRGRETGLIVQQLFKKIGVKVNPRPLDFPGIMKQIFGRKFDIASFMVGGSNDMGPVTMAFLHSKSPWNVNRYVNEEVDELLLEQRMSDDPEFRRKTLCAIAKKVNFDAPFLYLFGRSYRIFYKTDIHMKAPKKYGRIRLADAWMD